ncbi:hypothetical protein ACWGH4_20170 [Streptomyces sp. NPDC054847]
MRSGPATRTTSSAIVRVGGAERGKAVIILNPAEPPLMMRDTVFALVTLPEGEDGETAKARWRVRHGCGTRHEGGARSRLFAGTGVSR